MPGTRARQTTDPAALLDALDAHLQAMPPVAALRLRIAGYDGARLRLRAPLDANVNDKGCAFGGSLASLMTLWYVSGSVRAVMGATNDVYGVEEPRPLKVRYPISIALAAAITICVVGALLAVLVGPALARHGVLEVVVEIGRWVVAVLLLALAVGLLMRFAPAEPRPYAWVSGGCVIVIVAWVAATLIFRLFVTDLANFKTATGSLAVFLVLSGYVYTSAIIFLVGVELDELLRADAKPGEHGVLQTLGIARQ